MSLTLQGLLAEADYLGDAFPAPTVAVDCAAIDAGTFDIVGATLRDLAARERLVPVLADLLADHGWSTMEGALLDALRGDVRRVG